MTIIKPDIAGKHSGKRKKAPKEYKIKKCKCGPGFYIYFAFCYGVQSAPRQFRH